MHGAESRGGVRERLAPGRWARPFPVVICLLLVPSWLSFLTLERPDRGDDSVFFYHIPDLTRDPLAMIPSFVVGPLLNTQFDQMLLVTGLLLIFGITVERRLGIRPTLALFWATSIAAALGAGIVIHFAQAFFPDASVVESSWDRAYGGGSAAGFGFMGVLAALSSRPWVFVVVFVAWEASVWYLVLQNFTPAFHGTAFLTGYLVARYWWAREGGEAVSRPVPGAP